MNKKETNELISSLADYAFTIIECKKELENYAQLVDDMAFETTILRQRVAELEESYESMCEVERGLRKKLEAKNELR
jgi:hypothetical protein